MASAATSAAYSSAGPESVITVKINYDGCTRRAKMVLRDMVPGQLEQQIRTFLRVPSEHELVIERYSDSAAAYVVLDSTNTAIYKQLYRAAKAKSKLKLRVASLNAEKKPTPRAVTVEEVPDASSATEVPEDGSSESSDKGELVPSETEPFKPQQPAEGPRKPVEVTLPLRSGLVSKTYDSDSLAKAAQQLAEFESMRNDLTERLNLISTKMPELPKPSAESCSEVIARRMRQMRNTQLENIQLDLTSGMVARAQHPHMPCARNPQTFAVCCNSCDKTMPDVHYHCSTCDDGDFDLCSSCVDLGITCHSPSHWMIKRTTMNGQIVNSTTEVIPPKPKKAAAPKAEGQPRSAEPADPATCFPPELAAVCYEGHWPDPEPTAINASFSAMRTCNNCIGSFAEKEFLHCTSCEDFDLCKGCFANNQHGHDPMHGFTPAVIGTQMPENIKVKLAPGRNQMHHAICDGCDKFIRGVRHKCLDCPDWDYCATCHPSALFVHPGHRFVPIYTPLVDGVRVLNKSVHQGICCDGPLCADDKGYPSYIRGIRYKCAVCDDVDFCANCEAHPQLNHNKTHPLIKIKTPVRHINVTTMGEKVDGTPMRAMGDGATIRCSPAPPQAVKAFETKSASPPVTEKKLELSTKVETAKKASVPAKAQTSKSSVTIQQLTERLNALAPQPSVIMAEPKEQDLNATFIRDTVVDGTFMPPNHVFEQSWVLRNEGSTTWPAGCSVKYVGGDYMGHVDSNHPAEISKLVSASESIVCYDALAPGQEFAFTVLLRTPSRPGKFVSYWRLSTPAGLKFGHRLWCDVVVHEVKVEEPKPVAAEMAPNSPTQVTEQQDSLASSTMIFPKLEKESPAASMHEHTRVPSTAAPSTVTDDKVSSTGVPDESAEDEDWDVSEDGFLTDEEYDILDASDEELLDEQAKKLKN